MKNIEITLVIAIVDEVAGMKVLGEDIRVFIDGSVLNDCLFAFADYPYLIKPTVEKINLKMKGPSCHVFIKIAEVRIMFNGLIQRSPAIMLGKLFGESSFS